MFNEDEIQTFYTGRKIRINKASERNQNNESSQSQIVNYQEHHNEEPRFVTRMRDDFGINVNERAQERQNNPRITWHVNDQPHGEENTNSSLNRLVRAIQDNLDGIAGPGKQIIGVFGMDSDNLVINAMSCVSSNIRGNINYYELLPTSFRGDGDIYTLFAASIYNFCNINFNLTSYYRGDYYALQEIYVLLETIQSSLYSNEDYEEGLLALQRLSDRMRRPEMCRQVLRKVCNLLGGQNIKLIWKVEMSFGTLSREVLEQFSKLASGNFIIVFNMLTPLTLERSLVASNMGYTENASQNGHQILSKYIWFENLISCDE